MCEKRGKIIKSKCVDCKKFMCTDCNLAHKGIPSLKHHSVLPVSEEVKTLIPKIQNHVHSLETEDRKVLFKIDEMRKVIEDVKREGERNCYEIDSYLDYVIDEVNKHRGKLNKQVNDACQHEVQAVSKGIEKLGAIYSETQFKINFLKDVGGNGTDMVSLNQLLSGKDIEATLQKIRTECGSVKSRCSQSTSVVKSDVWDPEVSSGISIKVTKLEAGGGGGNTKSKGKSVACKKTGKASNSGEEMMDVESYTDAGTYYVVTFNHTINIFLWRRNVYCKSSSSDMLKRRTVRRCKVWLPNASNILLIKIYFYE